MVQLHCEVAVGDEELIVTSVGVGLKQESDPDAVSGEIEMEY